MNDRFFDISYRHDNPMIAFCQYSIIEIDEKAPQVSTCNALPLNIVLHLFKPPLHSS